MRVLLLIALGVMSFAHPAPRQGSTWTPETADLLFTSLRDGNSEIYLLPAGKTEWINLTKHPSNDQWPVWSPDGTRVAFQSTRSGNLDIWTMNADGSEVRRLTDHPETDSHPSWSPDGRTILFTSWRMEGLEENRAPHLYVMDADGENERRLVQESPSASSGATWSPDGKRIVYERREDKGADLYVADADGQNEVRVTNDADSGIHNGASTISPDGRWIAFHSGGESSTAIVVTAIDGTNRRTIISGSDNWFPRWSPDGRWLVYCAIAPGEGGNVDVLAVPIEGGGKPIKLVSSPRRDHEGSWRPTPRAADAAPSPSESAPTPEAPAREGAKGVSPAAPAPAP